jgi:hypothetical protein
MTFQTYNLNIPASANDPSVDQPLMQTNTNSTANLFLQDHFGFNDNAGGNHKQVHLKNEAAPGGIGANADGVFYANLANGQSWPFWQNTLGSFQILGQNSLVSPGYITLGGLIIQWGTNTSASGATISFPISFPTAVFSIQTTIFQSTTNRHFVYVRSSTNANFVTTQLDSGGAPETNTFSWVAIGN